MQTDTFQKHYNLLNSEQRDAVDTIDGPLLVLAGPGTGKTQLLSVRAANILKKTEVLPENILILTFTNAAARNMRERLAGILGYDGYNVVVETFHSFANSIVLESEGAIKYVKDKIEINEVEKVRAFEYILDNIKGVEALRPFGAPYIHRREIEKRISELKNEGIAPEEFKNSLKNIKADGIILEDKHIERLKALSATYETYEKLKDEDSSVLFDERGRRDYDDMILIAIDVLREDPLVRKAFTEQFKYIMIDEFQDTNGAQLKLLFHLLGQEKNNLCCVGDDDQSIFRFQGATLSNFRDIEKKLPSLKTIILKDNYRSCEEIIRLSDKIISQLPPNERIDIKELRSKRKYKNRATRFLEFSTEEEELLFLTGEVERQAELMRADDSLSEEERKNPFNNMAVLVRKRAQILKIIDMFLKAGIPYATDGEEDIRGEKRVKQMLDVLHLAGAYSERDQSRDIVLYRILVSDYFNIPHTDVINFVGFVAKKKKTAHKDNIGKNKTIDLFQEFQAQFGIFEKDMNGEAVFPTKKISEGLSIQKELEFKDPHALHKAGWAITRLVVDAGNRPVHDLVMRYIEDTGLYRFILKRYENDKVLRVREFRALTSFVTAIKKADLADPALRLDDFIKELNLRDMHNMPIRGELATFTQDGVRIYTSHKSKGLEFYTVFVPFCLQGKSWPIRKKADTIPLPPEIYKIKEKAEDKNKLKLLDLYDETRLFYVASTRAKANLFYTATPKEKVIASPFLGKMGLPVEKGMPADEEKFLIKVLRTKRSEDTFLGMEGVLKDIISDLTINPTSLNNYISCKRKFLYDNVLRLPGRKNQHLTFGNCAHEALEEVYEEFMDKKSFPSFAFFKNTFLTELEYQGVSDEIKIWCKDRLNTLEKWYDIEKIHPIMPIALENKLEISIKGGPYFRGTFDKIEKDGENMIRVVDYKTGKPDKHVKAIEECRDIESSECDDYYRQLVAYKMLYERSGVDKDGRKVRSGVLQFLEPVGREVKKYDLRKGEYKNISLELTDDMVESLEKLIVNCWKNIQSLDFEKLKERDSKDKCVRCEYDSICWEG
ncbi:MAG: ATP-dependent DNA helicase [Candidatus Omnitrophota bacterium]